MINLDLITSGGMAFCWCVIYFVVFNKETLNMLNVFELKYYCFKHMLFRLFLTTLLYSYLILAASLPISILFTLLGL